MQISEYLATIAVCTMLMLTEQWIKVYLKNKTKQNKTGNPHCLLPYACLQSNNRVKLLHYSGIIGWSGEMRLTRYIHRRVVLILPGQTSYYPAIDFDLSLVWCFSQSIEHIGWKCYKCWALG